MSYFARSAIVLPLAFCCAAVFGCSSGGTPSIISTPGDGATGGNGGDNGHSGVGNTAGTGNDLILPDGGTQNPEAGVSDLTITPADPVLTITIVNGKVTNRSR
jgi:hypothetical protein